MVEEEGQGKGGGAQEPKRKLGGGGRTQPHHVSVPKISGAQHIIGLTKYSGSWSFTNRFTMVENIIL